MVVLAMTGAGWAVGGQHNHNLEAMFVHAPGLKVVMSSSAADFKGLAEGGDPATTTRCCSSSADIALTMAPGECPDSVDSRQRSAARRLRRGQRRRWCRTRRRSALARPESLAAQGIRLKKTDLRTLKPLDEEGDPALGAQDRWMVVVHEANRLCGIGAEVSAIVSEHRVRRAEGAGAAHGPTRRRRRRGCSSRRRCRPRTRVRDAVLGMVGDTRRGPIAASGVAQPPRAGPPCSGTSSAMARPTAAWVQPSAGRTGSGAK
ncbi:MAG: hypothetical protein KF822_12195 [Steroidobacteraceae bacterium]|nr:hypothetical protein [Steroidobacteraceae bacterium]